MRNLRTLTAAIILASTLSLSATANDGNNPSSSIEFKHVGQQANQPVFQLNLNNEQSEEYIVIFRDQAGNTLYTEKFSGTNISRKYSFNKEELGDIQLKLEVKSLKTKKSEIFTINRTQSIVEETVVSRVN